MIKTNRISQPSQLLPHLPYRRRQRWCVSVFTDRTNATVYASNGNTYTTGTNNELTSDGDYTYTYDAEGNRTSKTNSSGTERELYTWDYRNRLTTITKQTYDTTTATWTTIQIVEYAYDYNNIWIRKTVGDSKTIFIPENYQTTVQIDNGAISHHYLWMPNAQDKLLADTSTDGVSWSLTDHLGTIRDVLDVNSSTHLIYDAFGNLTSGTNPLLFGFTGKAFDTDTNLQNNINRWYDATVGRWLSTDPIGFEGSDTNLYRYVKNMLVVNVDYWGLKEDAPMCNFLIFIGDNAYMWSLMRKNGLLSPPKPNKEFFGEYPDPQSKDWSIPEGTFVDGYFCWAGDFFENLPNRKNVLIRDWESMPQWGVGDIYNGMVPYLGIADYIRVILPMAEEKANTLRVNRCCNEISVKFKCSRDAKSEIKKQINRLKKELNILIQKQAKNIPQEEKFSIFCESLTILASLSQWLVASQLCDGKEIVL